VLPSDVTWRCDCE